MAREPKFLGTIAYTKQPVAGVTLYQDRRVTEPSIEEMLEELEKAEIRDVRKEELLKKIRARLADIGKEDKTPTAQPNPKRYLVDPATGKIDVNEEEGEYTYKDAQLVSASIKGKGGQADDVIKIVNAVREWGGAQTDKKTYVVTQGEQGAVVQEVESGKPLVLNPPTSANPPPTYFVDAEGNVRQAEPGEPIVVKQQPPSTSPAKTYIVRQTSEGIVAEEHDLGKPIIINTAPPVGSNLPPVMPFPVMGEDGKPVVDKDGKPVYANLEPMMKYWGFQADQRRADEQHAMWMGMGKQMREEILPSVPDGIQAILAAAQESKEERKTGTGSTQQQPQTFKCGDCGTEFKISAEILNDPRFESATCENCGRKWTKEELLA